MNRIFPLGALCLAAVMAGATPTLAQEETETDIGADFLAACVGAYGEDNTDFCTCKTEQATLTADEELIRYFIAFYENPARFRQEVAAGNVPEAVQKAWPRYVMESNKICLETAG